MTKLALGVPDPRREGADPADNGPSRWRELDEVDSYDGSYVENHCNECNEFLSECLCDE